MKQQNNLYPKNAILRDLFSNGPLIVFVSILLVVLGVWLIGRLYGN